MNISLLLNHDSIRSLNNICNRWDFTKNNNRRKIQTEKFYTVVLFLHLSIQLLSEYPLKKFKRPSSNMIHRLFHLPLANICTHDKRIIKQHQSIS